MMRILYIHHRPEISGAALALAHLIRELDREHYEPHVFVPPGEAAAVLAAAGAHVHLGPVSCFTHVWASVYRGRRWVIAARELALLIPHLFALWRLLRRARVDLVHLNDSPLVPAALLARTTRTPVVWHLRAALAEEGRLRRRLMRDAVQHLSTQVIAINTDVAASFGLEGSVVHDVVDLQHLTPRERPDAARTVLGLPTDRPLVAYVGYLYPKKGFRVFLEAAAVLRARGIDATHVLVGGAVRTSRSLGTPRGRAVRLLGLTRDYEQEARELSRSLGIEDLVVIVARVPDPAPFYSASDVIVHPSRGREVGLPAIEAAATGRPAIVTGSRTGAGVVVPDVTGAVVDGADAERLADAVASLLLDEPRRRAMGQAARRHAETHFDPATNARRVEEIYGRLRDRGR
jgi:glycosyltransferase involved in cell wall biosynthesis